MTTEDPDSDGRGWRRFGDGSVERQMLTALGDVLGESLRPESVELPDGSRVEVEGLDRAGRVIVQLVGNSGTLRSQYRNKALADMFKLVWLRDGVFRGSRAVLCVSETVAQLFTPTGWPTRAARDLRIDVFVLADDGAIRRLIAPEVLPRVRG